MQRMLNRAFVALIVFAALGCAKEQVTPTTTVKVTRTPRGDGALRLSGEAVCGLATLYFGFDSATLDRAARDQLARAARCIERGAIPQVHLVGATDPRGSEEYNLALGERRARAVREYLIALGVTAERLTYTSFGEELARGTDEATWAQDRYVASGASQAEPELHAAR